MTSISLVSRSGKRISNWIRGSQTIFDGTMRAGMVYGYSRSASRLARNSTALAIFCASRSVRSNFASGAFSVQVIRWHNDRDVVILHDRLSVRSARGFLEGLAQRTSDLFIASDKPPLGDASRSA